LEKLCDNSKAVLANLRARRDALRERREDGEWALVYLADAVPLNMPRAEFAGHLSALEGAGVFQPYGDEVFGLVRLP
jgi:hypothetical protein